MWAIRNKRTKKWLYGTDYSYCDGKPRQRTSFDRCMIFDSYETAVLEFRIRECGVNYELVLVKVEEGN